MGYLLTCAFTVTGMLKVKNLHLKSQTGHPDNCPNWHDPERQNPKWIQSRTETIPNGHYPELTRS